MSRFTISYGSSILFRFLPSYDFPPFSMRSTPGSNACESTSWPPPPPPRSGGTPPAAIVDLASSSKNFFLPLSGSDQSDLERSSASSIKSELFETPDRLQRWSSAQMEPHQHAEMIAHSAFGNSGWYSLEGHLIALVSCDTDSSRFSCKRWNMESTP